MTDEQIEIELRHLVIKVDKLGEQIEKFNDRFDGWLRWVIGLQLGSYILIIGGYFLHK